MNEIKVSNERKWKEEKHLWVRDVEDKNTNFWLGKEESVADTRHYATANSQSVCVCVCIVSKEERAEQPQFVERRYSLERRGTAQRRRTLYTQYTTRWEIKIPPRGPLPYSPSLPSLSLSPTPRLRVWARWLLFFSLSLSSTSSAVERRGSPSTFFLYFVFCILYLERRT